MREINVKEVTAAVRQAAMTANFELGEDMIRALEKGLREEESPAGQEVFRQLLENARIAREKLIPLCQDCGLTVVFAEVGQEVHLVGGDFNEAIQAGVRQGYQEGYLRKSLCHPLTRQNTGDNTPAVIYTSIVPGDRLKLIVVPKGGGSENMSRVYMLRPAAGLAGIKEKVVQTVREAGANPCPPTIIGVGIGGTFEQAALQAKKALLREVGSQHPDPELAVLEEELLTLINDLGIGPQGLGGRFTSLAVHINLIPCHIASLPVAVNVQCHASRHQEVVL
ncbi:MAG: fumarate hydratase [Deltaproteobacteria bacterium]|nr:fumarate hydratase [Deltaproteobacteria bacterium]MBW1952532.1 fumarate hydratase [Deltaproteobacteria bacterium]MBW1987293.1 fumarate hydratase [Deltaproteobacteria bacterium]MBW2135151.1 fumarate hydratase [Deltaproteobacteria bacterium]